jgi:3-phenylpropionate/trans-cinnamate dioxygenase ferredoxin subunit
MADLTLDQLEVGKPVKIEKDGKTICVARVGVECWLHGAEFDLRTGEALTLPANISLETYAVKIDGNSVTVEI